MKFNISSVYQFLKTAGVVQDPSKARLALSLIHEEYSELEVAFDTDNREEELDAITDLFWVISNYAYFKGFTYEELQYQFEKVEFQNFSKFDRTREDANKTVEMYGNGTHPNKLGEKIETYWEKNNMLYVIKRKSDDKILKSHTYKED